jgi:hypothetical protein
VHQVGFALRYHGGTVKPVNARLLTIPARAEAYQKRAGEFSDLEFLFGKGRRPIALIRRHQTQISIGKDRRKGRQGKMRVKQGKSMGGEIMFWLVEKTEHMADQTIIPDDNTLLRVVREAGTQYLDRLEQRREGRDGG